MKSKDLSILNVKIANPIKKIDINQNKNYHKPYGHQQLYYFRPKFKKPLSKDKGLGKILYLIFKHPNISKKDILSFFPGTGFRNEEFRHLKKAELITYDRKTNYLITPLGLQTLQYFDLI